MSDITATVQQNFESLSTNSYPGRGIIIGLSPDTTKIIQIYWIMGRSENSQNRIFLQDPNGFVRTKAFDESKMTDPSLIIYHPVKFLDKKHIVTNGDQTDTIFDYLTADKTIESALMTREYEPDGPNFTPRISGLVDLENDGIAYELSILKSFDNTEASSNRQFFKYGTGIPGVGHFISTYQGDGNPLPSFNGEPQLMPLFNDISKCATTYWNTIDHQNKVSLLVKSIDVATGATAVEIINKHS
ncbi:MAG: IMP cyclohydrolase [Fibrobacterales bacterium]